MASFHIGMPLVDEHVGGFQRLAQVLDLGGELLLGAGQLRGRVPADAFN